ncbi:MAG: glycosyltransferase [Candidatus Bathyarchaeia archaeon]
MISIIIPTLNEEENLEQCLRAILSQTFKDFEVFIVDGESKDGTVEIARKCGVRVFEVKKRRPHDVGFARNEGTRFAKGDILVFLDADTILSRNCLEVLDKYFREPDVIGVSFKTLPLKGNGLEHFLYNCNNVLKSFSHRISAYQLSYFSCLGYRREPFQKVGGFREDLYSCEDLDLARRLGKLGRFILTDEAICLTSPRRLRRWSIKGYLTKYIKFLTQYYLFNRVSDHYDDLC